ncbi:hypothetical protein [Nocardia sp. NPDC050175]|uniref:hypothetical protein n=1 Tax=Nocardia sp. NPDC050175 TaxID=3364317 RepID=UPI00378C5693
MRANDLALKAGQAPVNRGLTRRCATCVSQLDAQADVEWDDADLGFGLDPLLDIDEQFMRPYECQA